MLIHLTHFNNLQQEHCRIVLPTFYVWHICIWGCNLDAIYSRFSHNKKALSFSQIWAKLGFPRKKNKIQFGSALSSLSLFNCFKNNFLLPLQNEWKNMMWYSCRFPSYFFHFSVLIMETRRSGQISIEIEKVIILQCFLIIAEWKLIKTSVVF